MKWTHQLDEKRKSIKMKDEILKQCMVRADDWAEMVMVHVAGSSNDLHAWLGITMIDLAGSRY